ncbi:MAG: undecaprenyl-diphosphate phosphatase [Bacteriovoracaceae bacterium]|jgi:undecaprenyl-diphosphatase|nr:undecaprenyl-diphosphate phosphatase [Bacteriovoracaceae bacterium]
MNEWIAILYGFIQGVSEFLPVSSSGHLALLPHLVKIKDPGVIFDLVMHLGTAFAIILYFKNEVKKLVLEFLEVLKTRSFKHANFLMNFVMATAASVLLILILKDYGKSVGRNPNIIAFNLIFFGIVMYFSDRCRFDKSISMNNSHIVKAIIIGLTQALAVFPGVSRSGITLTSSRFLKITRVEASRFSFLMSLPIILASVAYKLPGIIDGEETHVSMGLIFIGVLSSFFFGLITIHFFLKAIAKIGLLPFTIYRIIIGVLVLFFSH